MKINVNIATTKELCELKGIGPALAKRITAYRKDTPFKKGKDLLKVKGISEDLLKDWKGQLAYKITEKKTEKKSTKPKKTTSKSKRKKKPEYEGEPSIKEQFYQRQIRGF